MRPGPGLFVLLCLGLVVLQWTGYLEPMRSEHSILEAIEAHFQRGELEAVMRHYAILLQDRQDWHYYSKRLFAVLAHPGLSPEAAFAYFQDYGQRFAQPRAESSDWPNTRDSERPLRVGYVSGDFCQHALARVISPLFRFHHSEAVESFIYSNASQHDIMSDWFAEQADHWRAVASLSDAALRQQIRDDQIDILVDTSGHSQGHRLNVFAVRAAPIQITMGLGIIATTGLPQMDYRLVDQAVAPPSLAPLNTEQLVYLSHHMRWDPPALVYELQARPELPFERNGFITFGSSNRSYKLNKNVLSLWASILNAVPGSKLSLKCHRFDRAEIRQYFISAFEARGIAPERLIFTGSTGTPEHILHNQNYDIALDSFPYQGGLTTYEALHMGVPVVALDFPGGSRAALSILSAVGCANLIARSPRAYLQIAVGLAQQIDVLKRFRENLRSRQLNSPVLNGLQYTREIEEVYRQVWRRWCAGEAPTSFHAQTGPCRTLSSEEQKYYLEEAQQCLQVGKLNPCITLCQEVLHSEPQHFEALKLLAGALFEAGQGQAAYEIMEQLIQLRPEDAHLRVNFALILRQLGHGERAQEQVRQAVKLAPELQAELQTAGLWES